MKPLFTGLHYKYKKEWKERKSISNSFDIFIVVQKKHVFEKQPVDDAQERGKGINILYLLTFNS